MGDYLDILISKAFESFPGEAYNRRRAEMSGRGGPPFLFYEVSLLPQRPWAYLRDHVYPNFVRYLKAKSLDPERGAGMIVAVFHEGRCYLLKGEDFISAFCEAEGLNSAAFHFRVLQWLSS